MNPLAQHETLLIRQKKEWAEILAGLEMRNAYAVMDEFGQEVFRAGEVGGSFLGRIFLKAWRPFTIHIVTSGDDGATESLRIERPFRFFFHTAHVYDASGQLLGAIQRRFSVLRRIYSITDASGQEVLQLFGPVLHPWTFVIQQDGEEIGRITKKWSGLLKEAFTVADSFGVVFPRDLDVGLKGVLLGAVFLIDFVHFENRS